MDTGAAAGATGPSICCTLLYGDSQGCGGGRSGRNTCGGRKLDMYLPVIGTGVKFHCCPVFF